MSTNSDQAVNKGYVHTKLANKVNSSIFQNVMRQVLYKADKRDLESYLKRDGSLNITGNLNVNNYTIKGLPTTTHQSSDRATSKDYVLTLINDFPDVYLDRAGSSKMTGNLQMDNSRITDLSLHAT